MPRKQKTPSFEEAMKELEALVESLEQGDLSLEESLKSFERGVALTRICQTSLQDAEQKVRMLNGNTQASDLIPFSDDDE
ncbi:MAG: exodeoxyribonuclease VII small subunit [gamma proteobacterium symbiont of Ctena orbiculata]|uniref:Exodeoxyribonuclease 7 small subunit n=1 Tax=Candidatus Thiodiazotropha taylori TaxID=2792791 RepID=A0A944M7G3_9GAMM|nr:exodeoxyribonuclease VII small subunit [Candidatus Thiodiazotropha taylori]PUB87443.1 MAG: exodeoxyribonuclease VII small subunit [gamma proteobacterium symbiont of Ctena orbiculata]MBT2988619.1 exodeoxyribonuclease VII small subunit [Candidatus Thiodiazotropha taylori]MBT2996812.1 exodeoxyribonuclease VII small subunit [Candidatus Thiodiazotropha taylori]MBT3002045.1 exodeoxyribonuclease VII small subunit [Candidatus Thiodiazotropha taylori]